MSEQESTDKDSSGIKPVQRVIERTAEGFLQKLFGSGMKLSQDNFAQFILTLLATGLISVVITGIPKFLNQQWELLDSMGLLFILLLLGEVMYAWRLVQKERHTNKHLEEQERHRQWVDEFNAQERRERTKEVLPKFGRLLANGGELSQIARITKAMGDFLDADQLRVRQQQLLDRISDQHEDITALREELIAERQLQVNRNQQIQELETIVRNLERQVLDKQSKVSS